ncbi:hypothetical protein FOA52_001560 [Chlamydomonas sp. UWO 241]|nr:hypothetical protein FOA52_001560 [Chlamydomonas sp. UWO 241]
MSNGLLGLVEVAISLKSLVNIELPAQGWYAVRFQMPVGPGIKAVWPASVMEKDVGMEPQPNQAWTVEPGGFRTSISNIRFCYEEIDISETFVLHLYVDAGRDLERIGVQIVVELMYQESDPKNPSHTPDEFDLKPVAKEVLTVESVAMAVHEHYGVTFDVDHFCLVTFAIVTALQGFTTNNALDRNADKAQSAPHRAGRPLAGGLLRRPSGHSTHGGDAPSMCGAGGLAGHGGGSAGPGAVSAGPGGGLAGRGGGGSPPDSPSSQASEGMSHVTLVPSASIRFPPLSKPLSECLAALSAPPIVGAATRCAGATSVLAMMSMDTAVTGASAKALRNLYERLAGALRRSSETLTKFLRQLPKQVYHPQSYASVHALMLTTAASMPSSPEVPAFNATGVRLAVLNIAAWAEVGDADAFMQQLPTSCSLACAVHHLDAVLERLRIEAAANWHVVMWVMRAGLTEIHRCLKCAWELEQPRMVDHWLSVNSALASAAAQAEAAAKIRKYMKANPPRLPRVHGAAFAGAAQNHPIFHIDDSMAQHRRQPAPPHARAAQQQQEQGQGPQQLPRAASLNAAALALLAAAVTAGGGAGAGAGAGGGAGGTGGGAPSPTPTLPRRTASLTAGGAAGGRDQPQWLVPVQQQQQQRPQGPQSAGASSSSGGGGGAGPPPPTLNGFFFGGGGAADGGGPGALLVNARPPGLLLPSPRAGGPGSGGAAPGPRAGASSMGAGAKDRDNNDDDAGGFGSLLGPLRLSMSGLLAEASEPSALAPRARTPDGRPATAGDGGGAAPLLPPPLLLLLHPQHAPYARAPAASAAGAGAASPDPSSAAAAAAAQPQVVLPPLPLPPTHRPPPHHSSEPPTPSPLSPPCSSPPRPAARPPPPAPPPPLPLPLPPRLMQSVPPLSLTSAVVAFPDTPRNPVRRAESPYSGGGAASPGSTRRDRSATHFVIFVHGFQGSSSDLCLVKGHLSLLYPYLECYSSSINENNTGDSIQDMGARLAKEVSELCTPYISSSRRPLSALSFVGHSMGNLIMRAALTCPEMRPFLRLLHLYVSICGPHVGQMYSQNAMLDAGVSLLKSVSSVGTCMKQLSFSDAARVEDCYLYKLAHKSTLQDFRYVCLVSSVQDRYVPFHSSRIAMCEHAANDSKRGPAYKAMVAALLRGVGEPCKAQLLRIDVDFDFRTRGFSLGNLINSRIGRQAHIEFIASSEYAHFLAWTLHRYKMLDEVPHAWL